MRDKKEIIRQAVTYRHQYNAEDNHYFQGHDLEKIVREVGEFATRNQHILEPAARAEMEPDLARKAAEQQSR